MKPGRWRFAALLGASLLALTATPVSAALQLQLDTQGLDAAQIAASQRLLDDALATLPPAFKRRLDETVRVRWAAGMPLEAYGEAVAPDAFILNRRLLPAVTDGSAATLVTGRPHGTLRVELLATLLHELTHLYDRAQLWSDDQARVVRQCSRRAGAQGDVGLPVECRGEARRRFTFSDDPRLLDLAGWPQRVGERGVRERRNDYLTRSPDRYELTNPREYVAVNMEYFLLDPSYGCRRPGMNRYFRDAFGWQPAHRATCEPGLPYLNAGSDFAKDPLGRLDPERIYEVDVLLAEGNEQMMSRWGHSMLRLVICRPGRPLGPDCRLDLDQHLVLSFRAFVNDVQLSSWDGLTGAYPSRLFVLPLSQVIEEYTKVELRALSSVPLKLDRQQIADLAERALQAHWSYDGHYYFVANNCAVETLKLLRVGVPDERLQDLDTITPTGLLAILENRGLADASPLRDPKEALRLGYRFDSYRDRFQAMFKVARERLRLPQGDVEEWLNEPALTRRAYFAHADLRGSAALLLLEQASLRQQLLLAQDSLKQRYLGKTAAGDDKLQRAGKAMQQVLVDSGYLSQPASLLPGGYGIPQPEELEQLYRESSQRQARLKDLSASLDKDLRSLLDPGMLAELDAIEDNLDQLGAHLRELHKAAGGLTL